MTADSERGEKLEERVDELEATVRGLTEELVDASERIRVLEEELDQTPSTEELREAREESIVGSEDTDGGEATKSGQSQSEDNEESELDGIIVA
jgi:predicted  nucleic acid-binding Zn-ribbon protein